MSEDINITAVVKKLIGEVNAVGDSRVDEKRYKSLAEMENLVEDLLIEINDATRSINNHQHSMKRQAVRARNFLRRVCSEFKPEDD